MEESKDPFAEIERTCTLFNARRAARAITDLYEVVLSPSGIHATQFTLLVAIKNHEPVSMSNLAEGLHTDRTTLTRTLKPLQEKGWVVIAPGADRRVQEVRLTEQGGRAILEAMPLWKQAQKQVQEQLGNDAWTQLLAHLQASAALQAQ